MAFNGFTDEFTNSPIQSTYPSYLEIDFTSLTSVQLEWVFENQNTLYPFSNVIQIILNDVDTNAVLLPDATVTSVGQTTVVVNSSSTTMLVKNYSGAIVATIDSTQEWQLTLTDNSSNGGVWIAIQLGATTSSATAASLIDNSTDANGHLNNGGLAAFPTNFLKRNELVYTFTAGATYTQDTGDRGNILIWEAGSGRYNCMPAATAGDGFVFTVINNSQIGGVITITPSTGDTINNSTLPFTINPTESSSFVSDGVSTIYSFSSAITTTNVTNLVEINLTTQVANVITLTIGEAQFSIQKYINSVGTSPYPAITINYPVNIVAEYIAYNASANNNIIVQINGEADSNYRFTITPGNRLFLFSDGTHLYNVPNEFINQTISFTDGSAASPSITFTNDTTTGLFRQTSGPDNGALGIAQGGVDVIDFLSTYINSNVPILLQNGSVGLPSLTFGNAASTGIYLDTTDGSLALTESGVETFEFLNPANGYNSSFNTINVVNHTYLEDGISIYSLMRAYG